MLIIKDCRPFGAMFIVGFVLFFSGAQAVWADYYKKYDSDGTVIFTNVPTTGGFTVIFDEYEDEYVTYDQYYYNTSTYDEIIKNAALIYGVDPALIKAVIKTESNFDPRAVSNKGACGLMQLIPATAERFGVSDVFDPKANIYGGTKYLSWLMTYFKGDIKLVLAAYNAGEKSVEKYDNNIPPYKETINYVKKVFKFLDYYKTRPLSL
jgi:soluble lytic murein transglycosylase-like protein